MLQKGEHMEYRIKDFMGNEFTVRPRLELVSVRNFMGQEMPGLAIALDDISGDGAPEQYCCLTVSFGEFIGLKNCAYIDVNNCDFADQLLEQCLAQDTGFTKHSGMCEYPLWAFDEQTLREMGQENYEKYDTEYRRYMESFVSDEDEDETFGMTM